MRFEQLKIEGAWLITPRVFEDERGAFQETFKAELFEEHVGHPFKLAQSNMSVSAAGVIRGIHYADIPPSQAKYVTCVRGSIVDVVVDLREGSETFGEHVMVPLDADRPQFVYLSEGLGHGFCALEDDTAVSYMVSAAYNPKKERGVDPLDRKLAIPWPTEGPTGKALRWKLSDQDLKAPTLADAREAGKLPTYKEAVEYRRNLKA